MCILGKRDGIATDAYQEAWRQVRKPSFHVTNSRLEYLGVGASVCEGLVGLVEPRIQTEDTESFDVRSDAEEKSHGGGSAEH